MTQSKRVWSLLIVILIVLGGGAFVCNGEAFKEYIRNTYIFRAYKHGKIAKKAVEQYKKQNISYVKGLQSYTVSGDYLNCGLYAGSYSSEIFELDETGIPKVKYGDAFYYNPVTVEDYALKEYGKAVNASVPDQFEQFLYVSDFLRRMQGEDGAFRYPFAWRYYLNKDSYEPGWISGLAQGEALSVFARAWLVTKEEKWIEAGNKALAFLMRPVSMGGPMSKLDDLHVDLKENIFFQEYISTPNNYTLNGFMCILLGLYDWKEISPPSNEKEQAEEAFAKGVFTLKTILPYYDIGGFSAYDLGFKTFKNQYPHIGIHYHAQHIVLLHALYSITNEPMLKRYEMRWRKYVD